MRRPALLLLAALLSIIGGAFLFSWTWNLSWFRGLYCAMGTAATVGCDVTPKTTSGRIAVILIVVTAVPLLAAAFAELTGVHVSNWWQKRHSKHLDEQLGGVEDRLRQHVTETLDAHHAALKEHITETVKPARTRSSK